MSSLKTEYWKCKSEMFKKIKVVNVHLPAVQETGFMTPWT